MRVLLISGSVSRLPDPVYPLGAAVVGTSLGTAGHQVSFFDALRHEDAPSTALEKRLAEVEPDVVMMSIRNIDSAAFPGVHRHFEEHLDLARACQRWGRAPLVLGGSGFSLMPEAFMAYLGADHGVVGEGERAAIELLAALEAGDDPGRLISADRVAPPFLAPDRKLFDADWYYQHGGMANLQTQRGCQLRCVYCTYPLLEGHKVRPTVAQGVVDELEAIKRAGIDHAFIVDAVFNRPEAHAAAICEEVLRRGLEMSLTGYFVPQGTLPELPELLKRAGFDAVELGTDSLSDPVLEGMGKGFTADEAIDFSRRLSETGIVQCHNLIFGGPGETLETMEESVARMDAIDPTGMIATIGLRIYPGT
ncbi:MAG: cobalamin-dependent protein, partial [Deltaproteobacteria bacterium]|nr:cobalamin-dependent protein [Deltaproteobacteria bacterium]